MKISCSGCRKFFRQMAAFDAEARNGERQVKAG